MSLDVLSETSTRIDAAEIAERLGLPQPTDQQRAVIEAPLSPAIVVAGAGSGKTETMANRVVWLLANRLVEPAQILGLTFTRKAAGELAARIRTRVAQLTALTGGLRDGDPFDAPTVSTYNAFASAIFRENALLIGREPDATVMSEASAWQLARRLVVGSSDERLVELDKSVDLVTSAVISLSRALSENVVRAEDVASSSPRRSMRRSAGEASSSSRTRSRWPSRCASACRASWRSSAPASGSSCWTNTRTRRSSRRVCSPCSSPASR
jgi:DNA helicase-2/ATP-dependent DNA helicase PcrA